MDLRQTPAWRRLFGVALTCGVCLVSTQESHAQLRRLFGRSQPQSQPVPRQMDSARQLPVEDESSTGDEGPPGYARAEGATPGVLPQERSSRGGLFGRIFNRGRSGSTDLPEPPPARGDRTEKKKSELLKPGDLQPIRERPVVPTLPGTVNNRGLEAPRSALEGSPRREPVAMEPAGRATISGPRTKALPPETSRFVPPPPTEVSDQFFSEDNEADESRTLDLEATPAPRRIAPRAPEPLPGVKTRPAPGAESQSNATRPPVEPDAADAVADDLAEDLDAAPTRSLPAPDEALESEGPQPLETEEELDDTAEAEEMTDRVPGDSEADPASGAEGRGGSADESDAEIASEASPDSAASSEGGDDSVESETGDSVGSGSQAPTTTVPEEEEEELGSAFDSPYRSAPVETRSVESQRIDRPGTPAARVTQSSPAARVLQPASLPRRQPAEAVADPATSSNAPLVPPKTPAARETPADAGDVPNRARATDAAEVVPTPRVANPTVGLMGYCPVALKDQRELLPIRPEIQSRFGGKLYQFSSEEAREAFEANPRLYMPALNGFDIVRNSVGERQVPGSLQYAAWYRGRLYLFQSAQTLQMFVQSPGRFVEFP